MRELIWEIFKKERKKERVAEISIRGWDGGERIFWSTAVLLMENYRSIQCGKFFVLKLIERGVRMNFYFMKQSTNKNSDFWVLNVDVINIIFNLLSWILFH